MHALHVHSRIATGEFVVDVYVLALRGNSPRESWSLDSPYSPVVRCSRNVVGIRATLDVLSSEHPGHVRMYYSMTAHTGSQSHECTHGHHQHSINNNCIQES